MKVLIAYDSVSPTKMTAKVAGIVADAMKGKGLEVELLHVREAAGVDISRFDCLVVGSPTMAWKPTKETMAFLEGLKGKVPAGKAAASFDTQMESFISGDANKAMGNVLANLGFKVVKEPLLAYVSGGRSNYQLKAGQDGKAADWARELADVLMK